VQKRPSRQPRKIWLLPCGLNPLTWRSRGTATSCACGPLRFAPAAPHLYVRPLTTTSAPMSLLFGKENPSPTRIFMSGCFVAAIFGMHVDFISSEGWYPWSLFVSIGVSVALATWAWSRNEIKVPEGISPTKAVLAKLFPVLLLPFICVFTVSGLADLVTQMIGTPSSFNVSLHKVDGQKFCSSRLSGKVFEHSAFLIQYVCIPKNVYAALPYEAPVTLEGRKSFLGFHIKNVYTQANPRTNTNGQQER
jgi:hypothetical protein